MGHSLPGRRRSASSEAYPEHPRRKDVRRSGPFTRTRPDSLAAAESLDYVAEALRAQTRGGTYTLGWMRTSKRHGPIAGCESGWPSSSASRSAVSRRSVSAKSGNGQAESSRPLRRSRRRTSRRRPRPRRPRQHHLRRRPVQRHRHPHRILRQWAVRSADAAMERAGAARAGAARVTAGSRGDDFAQRSARAADTRA